MGEKWRRTREDGGTAPVGHQGSDSVLCLTSESAPTAGAAAARSQSQLTPGSLMPQSPHFGADAFFLMCRYRSFPPGVLITRTLFDRVLYLRTV